VLTLRGDFPKGWECTHGDFAHADQMLAFLRENFPSLCLAAAGYPEKHLDAPSFEFDLDCVKSKQDNGAKFIMMQLCHDVDAFARYIEAMRKAGITLPAVAGLMPVLSRDPTIRMALLNGCSLPRGLAELIGKYYDAPDDFRKAGKEFTARQVQRLFDAGADGLHVYTLNKHEDITDILLQAGYKLS
jgi:methylenetetrahydrofolate reductase (NADPH)